MTIVQLTADSSLWPAYVDHLKRTGDAALVLDQHDQPRAHLHYLAAMDGEHIVGSLTMRLQPILEWRNRRVYGEGGIPRSEMFVQTFSVDEAHRRRGYGRALQQAGIDLAQELGCAQVRSWSSADRATNYALKVSLGFDASRTSHQNDETTISGVYFVKSLS